MFYETSSLNPSENHNILIVLLRCIGEGDRIHGRWTGIGFFCGMLRLDRLATDCSQHALS